MNILFNFSDRSTIAKFRTSAHKLMIETGRYTNIDYDNRLCTCCNMNCVEDEIHFLFHCPLYTQNRLIFFSKIRNFHPYFHQLNSKVKIQLLLNSNKREILKTTSNFINDCLEIRKTNIT